MNTFENGILSVFNNGKKERWQLLEEIGQGSYAIVYLALNTITKQRSAIKQIIPQKIKQNQKLIESLKLEINTLQQLDHRNIVKCFGVYQVQSQRGPTTYIILEYCEGGDLQEYSRQYKQVDQLRVRKLVRQLAIGLQEMQKFNLIHRDLKPQNLLLSNKSAEPDLKIADFGFTRSVSPQSLAMTVCGSPLYMAPEILRGRKYDMKADLWSVGAITYELLTGKTPYVGVSQVDLLHNIENNNVSFPPEIKKDLSNQCQNFVLDLLQKDPIKRLNFKQFINHSYLILIDNCLSIASVNPYARLQIQVAAQQEALQQEQSVQGANQYCYQQQQHQFKDMPAGNQTTTQYCTNRNEVIYDVGDKYTQGHFIEAGSQGIPLTKGQQHQNEEDYVMIQSEDIDYDAKLQNQQTNFVSPKFESLKQYIIGAFSSRVSTGSQDYKKIYSRHNTIQNTVKQDDLMVQQLREQEEQSRQNQIYGGVSSEAKSNDPEDNIEFMDTCQGEIDHINPRSAQAQNQASFQTQFNSTGQVQEYMPVGKTSQEKIINKDCQSIQLLSSQNNHQTNQLNVQQHQVEQMEGSINEQYTNQTLNEGQMRYKQNLENKSSQYVDGVSAPEEMCQAIIEHIPCQIQGAGMSLNTFEREVQMQKPLRVIVSCLLSQVQYMHKISQSSPSGQFVSDHQKHQNFDGLMKSYFLMAIFTLCIPKVDHSNAFECIKNNVSFQQYTIIQQTLPFRSTQEYLRDILNDEHINVDLIQQIIDALKPITQQFHTQNQLKIMDYHQLNFINVLYNSALQQAMEASRCQMVGDYQKAQKLYLDSVVILEFMLNNQVAQLAETSSKIAKVLRQILKNKYLECSEMLPK